MSLYDIESNYEAQTHQKKTRVGTCGTRSYQKETSQEYI
jgi:hypothetical protein